MRAVTPDTIRPPLSRYSHAIEVEAGKRLLFASGQLGDGPDGRAPEGAEAQTRVAFANLDAILAEAGMGRGNVVRLNAYVTGAEHLAGFRAARDEWIEGLDIPPASTLVIVAGLARPDFVVEIELVAAG
ncbi:MAG: RidA family protein [Pseudomonadota bacterium]